MDELNKWTGFLAGASPTLFYLLMALIEAKDLGAFLFMASPVYLIIGVVIYFKMSSGNSENKSAAGPFLAGVVSGFAASFFLSAQLCYSGMF